MANPVGRPLTKLKDLPKGWKKTILAIADEGGSKVEMAVKLGMSRDLLYRLMEDEPEFLDTIKEATARSQAWWESAGRKATFDSVGFAQTAYIFQMKNRFPQDWREKVETDVTSSDGSLSKPIEFVLNAVPVDKSKYGRD